MAKLFKLENTTTEQLIIVGIVSSENDYKISWSLNESLQIGLKRSENIKLPNKTGINPEFALYSFEIEENSTKYHLIQNRSQSFFYIDELKKFDYILLIHGEPNVNSLLKQIKSSSLLSSSFLIDPKIIKNQSKFKLL